MVHHRKQLLQNQMFSRPLRECESEKGLIQQESWCFNDKKRAQKTDFLSCYGVSVQSAEIPKIAFEHFFVFLIKISNGIKQPGARELRKEEEITAFNAFVFILFNFSVLYLLCCISHQRPFSPVWHVMMKTKQCVRLSL